MTVEPSPSPSPTPPASFWGPFRRQPNILILMTDQQRTAQHYPRDWVRNNLPNLHSLQQRQRGGVTFPNAMTNTTACSPSRATLFTGTYPAVHGVTEVGMTLDPNRSVTLPGGAGPPLPLATLGQILGDESLLPPGVEYEIAYKGKWHLNSEFQWGLDPDEQREQVESLRRDNSTMEDTYGFPGWTSPEIGNKMDLSSLDNTTNDNDGAPDKKRKEMNTLGAGVGGNDERVAGGTSQHPRPSVRSAVDFLHEYTPNEEGTNPFLLVVSLVNPHDVWVYPSDLGRAGWTPDKGGKYPWQYPPFTEIALPDTHHLAEEELANKPSIQGEAPWRVTTWDSGVATDYVRFYAYLETLSDALLGEVVAALRGGNPHGDLEEDTLIVRLADHGEMGMAQGGMREKEHNCYNETLLVPMTFSNPGLVPKVPPREGGGGGGTTCTGLAGLVDVVPTIAAVAGIDPDELSAKYPIQGTSLDGAILEAAGGRGGGYGGDYATTYDRLLFVTDDGGAHIRCLVRHDGRRRVGTKYAVYYRTVSGPGPGSDGNPNGTAAADFQYEMYPFSYDAGVGGSPPAWDAERGNLLPVDGIEGAGGSPPRPLSAPSRVLWHDMHVALTAKLAECGQMPDNWPDPPPLPGGRLSSWRSAISRWVNGAFG